MIELIGDGMSETRARRGSGDSVEMEWADWLGALKDPEAGNRRKFDPVLAEKARELQKRLKVELLETIARVKGELGIGDELAVTDRPAVRVPGPKGGSEVYTALISLLLSAQANKSQKELRAQVQDRFPDLSVPKDWNRQLPSFSIRNIRTKIAMLGQPYASLKIKKGMTLAGLQRQVQNALIMAEGGGITFSATIRVAASAVLINGVQFKVTTNKAGGKYVYKEVRLRVPQLLTVADNLQEEG